MDQPESTIVSEGFKGGTRGAPIMPRDAVSRTAHVERNGGHKWVKIKFQRPAFVGRNKPPSRNKLRRRNGLRGKYIYIYVHKYMYVYIYIFKFTLVKLLFFFSFV